MSHHGKELYQGDYRKLSTLVEKSLSALRPNLDTLTEPDKGYYHHLADLKYIIRSYTPPEYRNVSNFVSITQRQYRECVEAVEKREPFWNPSVWSWNFDFYKEVVKILFHSYSAKVKQDETARNVLPTWWHDTPNSVNEEAWQNFAVSDKHALFHYANDVVNMIEHWPERGEAFERFARLAFVIDFDRRYTHKVPTSSDHELSGDDLSKAISNLVNATERAHNILSKNVESATVQGSHVLPDRLADLRLQLQELDATFLILKRSREGAEHPRLGQAYRLAFTQAQCVQCLTHLLRVAYGTEDSILTDDSPLLDLIWLHCPYFEIFSFERELFLKFLPEGSTWGSTLEAVSEAKWNNRRVPSTLRSVINSSITRDRIDHQNSLRERTKYSKVYREALFDNLAKLLRLAGSPEVYAVRSRRQL